MKRLLTLFFTSLFFTPAFAQTFDIFKQDTVKNPRFEYLGKFLNQKYEESLRKNPFIKNPEKSAEKFLVYIEGGFGPGSGVIVKYKGENYVLTAAHVSGTRENIAIVSRGAGAEKLKTTGIVVYSHYSIDFALIKLKDDNFYAEKKFENGTTIAAATPLSIEGKIVEQGMIYSLSYPFSEKANKQIFNMAYVYMEKDDWRNYQRRIDGKRNAEYFLYPKLKLGKYDEYIYKAEDNYQDKRSGKGIGGGSSGSPLIMDNKVVGIITRARINGFTGRTLKEPRIYAPSGYTILYFLDKGKIDQVEWNTEEEYEDDEDYYGDDYYN